MAVRSPIIVVAGHVDHGKSSILDYIRGTSIISKEAGGITQAIGASIISLDSIKRFCGQLLERSNTDFSFPGLLFVDTPGHAAFTNIRKRGGNLSDIAILVIDINEGFMPQTEEVIEILKTYKTPFIIAANKIDVLPGWKSEKDKPILQNIGEQTQNTAIAFETKLYEIVGKLGEFGLNADRFDRVNDYTQQVAIIPTSAKTGEGIPELLMVLMGITQKYLEQCLKCDTESPAKGVILEVKEEKGLGKTLDVIIYNGKIKKNDTIIVGTLGEPIVTKVRALLQPNEMSDMRDIRTKFKPVPEAVSATGIKISAPDLDEAVSGMPIQVVSGSEIEEIKQKIKSEVQEVVVETDKNGIIIKADTLGSLEALTNLLAEKNITIRKATIGDITKKDISEAESNKEVDPLKAVVLAFNSKASPEVQNLAKSSKVKIISSQVIYKIIEDFELWQEQEKKKLESKEIETLVSPCKFEVMKGYIFRQSNPAVFGGNILQGTLRPNSPLMKSDGQKLAPVKGIQENQENVEKAEKGKQVAVAVNGITIGRQINEGDIIYSDIPEEHFRRMKELKKHLSQEQKDLLKEIANIKRENNPVWGV